MSRALHALMTGLVDYAGLFPPAGLDMTTAVDNYARYRTQAESWMLGRFIVPAGRLDTAAAACAEYLSSGDCWGFSVLLGSRENPAESLDLIPGDGRAVAAFESELESRARVEVLETALPADVSGDALAEFLDRLKDALVTAHLDQRELFLELPAAGDDVVAVAAIAELSASSAGTGRPFPRIGVKLRCGGLTPEAFPSCARVARVVAACRDHQVALKCTAGLHHPVRCQASEPEVMMHGFLNVFGAGLLAHALKLEEGELERCVAETEADAFTLRGGSFGWRDHLVDAATTRQLRSRFLCGFGSCSFKEPREDLFNLGLL